MSNFLDLFEYNGWANRAVLAAADQLTPEELAAPMPELGGSALDLLSHTSRVESSFLAVLVADATGRAPETRDYAAIRDTFLRVADDYLREIPELSTRLGDSVHIPWWERSFPVEQVLTQVATHSVQHRAGVCAGIARAGKEAPGLDYIMWLDEAR